MAPSTYQLCKYKYFESLLSTYASTHSWECSRDEIYTQISQLVATVFMKLKSRTFHGIHASIAASISIIDCGTNNHSIIINIMGSTNVGVISRTIKCENRFKVFTNF